MCNVTCDGGYHHHLLAGAGGQVEVYLRSDSSFARANGVDGPPTMVTPSKSAG